MSSKDFVDIILALSVFAEKHLHYMKDSGSLEVDDVSKKYGVSKGKVTRVSFKIDIANYLYEENTEGKEYAINTFLEFLRNKSLICNNDKKKKIKGL